LFDILRLKTDS